MTAPFETGCRPVPIETGRVAGGARGSSAPISCTSNPKETR
jgi:hypothetical protein